MNHQCLSLIPLDYVNWHDVVSHKYDYEKDRNVNKKVPSNRLTGSTNDFYHEHIFQQFWTNVIGLGGTWRPAVRNKGRAKTSFSYILKQAKRRRHVNACWYIYTWTGRTKRKLLGSSVNLNQGQEKAGIKLIPSSYCQTISMLTEGKWRSYFSCSLLISFSFLYVQYPIIDWLTRRKRNDDDRTQEREKKKRKRTIIDSFLLSSTNIN